MGRITELAKINEKLTNLNPSIVAEYYVSPEGNNSQDGKTLGKAFLTVEKGINVLNNLPSDFGVALWIAPGTYIERSGILLETDLNIVSGINGIPGSINIIGSGTSGELTSADSNLLTIQGRKNLVKGLTMFCNSPNWSSLSCLDKDGGGGYGGQNTIEYCNFFYGISTARQKYGIGLVGSKKVVVRKCSFNGINTAGILIIENVESPTDIIIEECNFVGTQRGIIVENDNFNTVIRKNWFSAGSRTDEAMANAIEIKVSMTAGKLTAYKNNFEQSSINAILDNKAGGSIFVYGDNEYGA